MMNSRWSIYFFIGFISLAVLFATISAVTGAQSREQGENDEDTLDDPLPKGVGLRVFIHRPRVLKPNHLGLCTETSSDSGHFELEAWHLSGPITWSLNPKTVPGNLRLDDVNRALVDSFAAWYSGVFTRGADTKANRAKLDKVNAILWKKLARSTLGLTFVWYSRATGELVEVDTVFNKRHPWAIFSDSAECQSSPDAYDLQNIATHEFGHWIGLDDLYDSSDKDLTMYGFGAGGETKKRTPGTGDVNGMNNLLP
jgi:hypothetical protein